MLLLDGRHARCCGLGTGQKKWWSTSHFSNNFEVSLKLQSAGCRIWYAINCENGLKNVYLTIYDEPRLWDRHSHRSPLLFFVKGFAERYKKRTAELMFYPFKPWLKKGHLHPSSECFWDSMLKILQNLRLLFTSAPIENTLFLDDLLIGKCHGGCLDLPARELLWISQGYGSVLNGVFSSLSS